MTKFRLVNQSNGRTVGDRVLCADTFFRRLIGLLTRDGLLPGEGLWIMPSSGVHTFGMRFAIDVVGLDTHMRVVRVWSDVTPQRITGIDRRVHSVVELAAGEIQNRMIQVGDVLQMLDQLSAMPAFEP